jgi:AAA ATPase domain
MDPIKNPYAPGAGSPPPELAGRDDLREKVRIALERNRLGRSAKSLLMVGLRGVGKTVLLTRMREDAERSGIQTVQVEAPEGRSLPSFLAPQLRQALLGLSLVKRAQTLASRGLRALAGFVRGLRIKYEDIEVRLDMEPEPGLADNGVLDEDLRSLLEAVGEACRAADRALALFVDELQYVPEEQLAALIMSLHHTTQRRLPVIMVGAGLPQLRGRMGKAKSYAERLFDFPEVGPLSEDDARHAIEKPARDEGAEFEPNALKLILSQTHCYPYFLQEWGKHVWDVAETSPIRSTDVEEASMLAIAALDESFFRVRFDRMTPTEKIYLRAMAELGPGPHRSGDIAGVLKRKVTALGPIRSQLIAKGMIWSPGHGDTAFTVPLFDEFMKRTIPGDDWRS